MAIRAGDQFKSVSNSYICEIINICGGIATYKIIDIGSLGSSFMNKEYVDAITSIEDYINKGLWSLYASGSSAPVVRSEISVKIYPNGMNCHKCNMHNVYAIPNRGDQYICFECR